MKGWCYYMRNNFAHKFDRLVDTFPDKVKEMFLKYRNDVYFGYIASGSSTPVYVSVILYHCTAI